jgi:hypothetical protein
MRRLDGAVRSPRFPPLCTRVIESEIFARAALQRLFFGDILAAHTPKSIKEHSPPALVEWLVARTDALVVDQ